MTSRMTEYRMVLLGARGVGKSSLAIRFCLNVFNKEYSPTDQERYRKRVTVDEHQYIVEVTDTGGQDEQVLEFEPSKDYKSCIEDADGFLLVYDISSRSSFSFIQKLYNHIVQVESLPEYNCTYRGEIKRTLRPVIVIGNKNDLILERKVSFDEGRAMAQSLGCHLVETSTITSAESLPSVERVFHDVVRMVLDIVFLSGTRRARVQPLRQCRLEEHNETL